MKKCKPMTLEGFFRRAARIKFHLDGIKIRCEAGCPITAVADAMGFPGYKSYEVVRAAEKIGLPESLALQIALAADSNAYSRTEIMKIRKRLLKSCAPAGKAVPS